MREEVVEDGAAVYLTATRLAGYANPAITMGHDNREVATHANVRRSSMRLYVRVRLHPEKSR